MAWKNVFVVASAGVALLFTVSVAAAQGDAKRGEKLYQMRGCAGCHGMIGNANHKGVAPNLTGVSARRSGEWLHRWLKETSTMITSDSTAAQLVKEYKGAKMPTQKLSEDEINSILAFVKSKGG